MSSATSEIQVLAQRITKLERQNRALRHMLLITVVAGGAVLLMGQARPSDRVIEAREFVVKDDSGAVRARLGAGLLSGSLIFYDRQGHVDTMLSDSQLQLTDPLHKSGVLVVPQRIAAFVSQAWWSAEHEKATVSVLDGTGLSLYDETGSERITLRSDSDGNSLRISDKAGFEAALGNVGLETERSGETTKTSAASLVLFDKAKRVIWRTP